VGELSFPRAIFSSFLHTICDAWPAAGPGKPEVLAWTTTAARWLEALSRRSSCRPPPAQLGALARASAWMRNLQPAGGAAIASLSAWRPGPQTATLTGSFVTCSRR
jgi:hypothetical protein